MFNTETIKGIKMRFKIIRQHKNGIRKRIYEDINKLYRRGILSPCQVKELKFYYKEVLNGGKK